MNHKTPAFKFNRTKILSIALVVFAGACGSDPAPNAICASGSSVGCTCSDGRPGAQVCNASGGAYGACDCGALVDGGAPADMNTLADMSATPDMAVVPDMGASVCDDAALATGTTYFYVVHILSMAGPEGAAEPFASAGFNLDSDAVVACNDHIVGGTAEFNGQAPDFGSGIDNALGGDLGGLANTSIQEGVDAGSTLLLVEVEGVDSLTNDACVGVAIYPGTLAAGTSVPARDSAGHLAPGQSFDASALAFWSHARIVGGRVQAGPSDFPGALPFLGPDLPLPLRQAQVRFNITASALSTGVIGGSANTDEVIAAVTAIPSLATYVDVVSSTLSSLADIDDNGSPTTCEAGSIAFKFDGVTAQPF
jgi:hypothetical protein